jgi:hypothetical protein
MWGILQDSNSFHAKMVAILAMMAYNVAVMIAFCMKG